MSEFRCTEAQPFTFSFVDDIIVSDWQGKPTVEWVRESYHQAVTRPEFRKGMPTLAHIHSEMELPDAGSLAQMASEMASYSDRLGPTALVLNSEEHLGHARALSAYCSMSGFQISVFTQVQEAFAWIRREMEHKQPA